MTRHWRKFALLVLAGAAAAACSPGYVLRAAWEEGKILSRRKPIARIVQDTATDWETRDKLLLVLQARQFAADSLGLNAGNSYTLFSRVDSDTLVMVLSAAYKDRFQPRTWWFPIVGDVPYKGFFELEDARREQRRLEARGFDTYLRPSAAFSTLGWFNDPLLSTVLRYPDVVMNGRRFFERHGAVLVLHFRRLGRNLGELGHAHQDGGDGDLAPDAGWFICPAVSLRGVVGDLRPAQELFPDCIDDAELTAFGADDAHLGGLDPRVAPDVAKMRKVPACAC